MCTGTPRQLQRYSAMVSKTAPRELNKICVLMRYLVIMPVSDVDYRILISYPWRVNLNIHVSYRNDSRESIHLPISIKCYYSYPRPDL